MSKVFYAINRESGELWKPDTKEKHQYLMLYDSGYAAVVTEDFYTHVIPLDAKHWRVVFKGKH